jgi:diacylglycerol kinase family enzyme
MSPPADEASKVTVSQDDTLSGRRGRCSRRGWTRTQSHRWLARLSFFFAIVAIALVAVLAGLRSLAMFAVGLAGAMVFLIAAYFFLSRKGFLRWCSLAVMVLAPCAVIVVYAFASLLWVALVSAGAWLLAGLAARQALGEDGANWRMPEVQPRPVARPFLIMNPRSGGGKVARFGLQRKAEELGAEVFVLDGHQITDVAAVAEEAVASGADLLGVAGGDGTQALVAEVAARHDLPFLVITAGTRNHFALDLGLDRENPAACLDALTDGVELRVDLGQIESRTFVNNVSFGAYAQIVESPAYRDDKVGTTLDLLPEVLERDTGERMFVQVGEMEIAAPDAVLVSNNPYGSGDIAGLSRRSRLDRGVLGIVAVSVHSARQAVSLLRGTRAEGLRIFTGGQVVVSAGAAQLPVAIDGEAVCMPSPVRCSIRPGALRVRVPRQRPGVPAPKRAFSWARLWRLAMPAGREDPGAERL